MWDVCIQLVGWLFDVLGYCDNTRSGRIESTTQSSVEKRGVREIILTDSEREGRGRKGIDAKRGHAR